MAGKSEGEVGGGGETLGGRVDARHSVDWQRGRNRVLLELFLIVVSGAGDKHRYLADATSPSQLTRGKFMQGEALRARFHAMGLFSKCAEGASCVRPKGGGRVRALWAAIMSALKILPGACARGTAPQRSHLCVRKPMDDQMVY